MDHNKFIHSSSSTKKISKQDQPFIKFRKPLTPRHYTHFFIAKKKKKKFHCRCRRDGLLHGFFCHLCRVCRSEIHHACWHCHWNTFCPRRIAPGFGSLHLQGLPDTAAGMNKKSKHKLKFYNYYNLYNFWIFIIFYHY